MTPTTKARWQQIADELTNQITSGDLGVGDRLPTSRAIQEVYGVKQSTVTKVLNLLRERGLVESRGTAGTVVIEPPEFEEISLESILNAVEQLHETVEADFTPIAILTMSGRGSFIAYLFQAENLRTIPVMSAVTFPVRDKPSSAERQFKKAFKSSTWRVLETGKWRVYLPKGLSKYEAGSRILVLDDRVLTATTQKLARDVLEAEGFEVRTAALVASAENTVNVDYVALVVDNRFRFPWGIDRGRT